MKLHRQSHTTWTDTKAKTAGGSPLVVGTTKTRAEGEIPAWGQHPAMPTDVSFQEGHGPGEIRLGGLQLSRSGELGLHDKADLSVDRQYQGMNGETESLGAHVTSSSSSQGQPHPCLLRSQVTRGHRGTAGSVPLLPTLLRTWIPTKSLDPQQKPSLASLPPQTQHSIGKGLGQASDLERTGPRGRSSGSVGDLPSPLARKVP